MFEHSMHKAHPGETFPAGGNQQIFFLLTTVRGRSSVSISPTIHCIKLHCLTNYGSGVKVLLGITGWDGIPFAATFVEE